jgi:division protein CdvB (Snf7/Vps24/ESCRT-III family)
MSDGDGWDQYAKHVLAELQRLSSSSEAHAEALNDTKMEFVKEMQAVRVEIAMLKMKAGVWGLVAGAIPPICMILLWVAKTLVVG